ncbi:MAG: extracellular solute-binding protein [Chloroflexi bacterium]|nr:extracellular solute-binding protein [Chloroflexota bacterium]MCI0579843.1 extracellular solute-binding protein [Chloroflexota bacterium]MCI0645668.1 extracellular solute-binding protein [Chloroflexota bacterium]MCI0725580.1 extracellular solute-binding protein [Chloroflexota bacterium]
MIRSVWICLLCLLLLPACTLLTGDESDPAAAGTAAVIPTPAITPTTPSTPQATEPAAGPQLPLTLTIWLVPDVSTQAETPGSAALAQQLAAFEESHPDVRLNLEIKTPAGQGGTLSYLRTGRGVAPSILPDVVVLPLDRLATAAAEQLIYPLDSYVGQEMLEDLFPVASTLARPSGPLVGYPFALTNVAHLAYNTTVITGTLPTTWEAMVTVDGASFVFPAGSPEGAELALQFYLAAGGTLANEANQPVLQVEPLANALNQFSRGRNEGFILLQSSNLTTLADSWQLFATGVASVVGTRANQYLNERASSANGAFAPIPGLNGPMPPLVMGWAWTISTPDPVRQALAGELIAWLASGPNLGDWSLQSLNAPARRSAFERWPTDDAYVAFLQAQLEQAQPYPATATSLVLSALGTAVFDVISLAKPPQVAAEEAAAALQP